MNNLIANHLNQNNLKLKIYKINSICAFSGKNISEGVLLKDLIKKTFTDYEYVKFNSEYVSIDITLLIEEIIPISEKSNQFPTEEMTKDMKEIGIKSVEIISDIKSKRRFNSIRNYSFFANLDILILLKRDEILKLLLNIPSSSTGFQVGITYSHKKHIAYKAPINFDTENYQVITDLGIVNFEKQKAIKIIKIAQKWYTVLPEKINTEAKPTFFTKDQIKGFSLPNYNQIKNYGIVKYMNENKELEKYRKTLLFNLIIHLLNKQL